uniref:Uncharacterized protein n=2 Tax=Caenorhabditis japonica TaxID=281687 RepID=A0A8R1ES34_CAEJA
MDGQDNVPMKINNFERADEEIIERRDSEDSSTAEDVPITSGSRRNSLINQFRDFLYRTMDFSVQIDDPFEKSMY